MINNVFEVRLCVFKVNVDDFYIGVKVKFLLVVV